MDSKQVATVLNRVMRKIEDGSIKPENALVCVVDEFCREFAKGDGFHAGEFIGLVNKGVI